MIETLTPNWPKPALSEDRDPASSDSCSSQVAYWLAVAIVAFSTNVLGAAQQVADPDFDPSVELPAYVAEHPRIIMDEAHHNLHTMEGRYRPLAQLLAHDGYDVTPGRAKLSAATLQPARVLVISNARGADRRPRDVEPAFTASECDAVREWVREGGSLLLIADHAPFGKASHDLALRFGVEMYPGYAFDPKNSEDDPTFLVFSQENGLLADHPVTRGRNEHERVRRIVAFTGQSLSVPPGATALMRFAPSAREVDSYANIDRALSSLGSGSENSTVAGHLRPITGRAQGVALVFGKGRVIVMGEAAMFSAQVLKSNQAGKPPLRFGMNTPGNDDRQFALNAIHWLSGAIP